MLVGPMWGLSKPSPCFFFNDTATTEIYTLSLHDALPISYGLFLRHSRPDPGRHGRFRAVGTGGADGFQCESILRAGHAGVRPHHAGSEQAVQTRRLMIDAFHKHSGPTQRPRVYRAPGRVNLIGEHTDYNLGF